jgi:hypothetical protein
VPSRATVGRWVQQSAQQSRGILEVLDRACQGLVPRFRNNVMVFGPGLLPQWEALRWSLRSLSPKDVSHAWSPTELPP